MHIQNDTLVVVIPHSGVPVEMKGSDHIGHYFQVKELADPLTNTLKLRKGFMIHLDYLRHIMGVPFVVNSCCRSEKYNLLVGGHPRSLHLMDNLEHNTEGTCALDLNVTGWSREFLTQFTDVAKTLGWSLGIGYSYPNDGDLAVGFLHLDRRVEVGLPLHTFYY